RPGADTAYDEGQMKIGRRLAIKILNASRFVLGFGDDVGSEAISLPLDRAMLARLEQVIGAATAAFEQFDYARALDVAESAFWSWTDDYLELVKGRAYGEGDDAASAQAALQLSLSVFLRLLAPFLPYVTEEAWSWWQEGSVHRSGWPTSAEVAGLTGDAAMLDTTAAVRSGVRRAKSDAKVSMRTPVAALTVTAPDAQAEALRQAASDLLDAAKAESISYRSGEFAVEAQVANPT